MHHAKICPGLVLAALIAVSGWSLAEEEEDPKLLGRCTVQELREEPFGEWFQEGYGEYQPDPEVLVKLRQVDSTGIEIKVFFGTWCGDSQREVPRLMKLLEDLRFPAANVSLVALDHVDEAHKQSPDGEEKGMEIYRVPTVVVSRQGAEIARIVETPVLSLERDLLKIFAGEPYESLYPSYPVIRRWLQEGFLSDENISNRGLAAQVRHLINSEGDLAAAGRVFLTRGDTQEGVKVLGVNCALYPRSSRCFARLAAGLQELGDEEEARKVAERALRLNTDPDRVKDLVALIANEED